MEDIVDAHNAVLPEADVENIPAAARLVSVVRKFASLLVHK